jgi:glycosyltransferase involved in cell wall biosynthesis
MDLSSYDWFWRLSFFLEKKLSRFADLIIVNSYAGMEYSAQNGFPMEKMIVIPNGIETTNFIPQLPLREKTRKEWGISNNETLIGLVARLDPKKDHITFLKAAAQVSRVRPDVRFVCVGRGDEIYYKRLRHVSDEFSGRGRETTCLPCITVSISCAYRRLLEKGFLMSSARQWHAVCPVW